MKKIFLIINVICFIVMTSCTDDSMDMGKVTYHPSFWFLSSADTVPLVKTFEFDFSNDARANKDIYAEFQFVDNDGKPISSEDMMVYVDGQLLADNSFRVTSADSVKEIKYIFPSTAKGGKHQGYLKLKNHNLHRLDNQQLAPGQTVDVFQWTIYFDKKMNPLAKTLMWIGIVVLSLILFWVLIFRKFVFPTFRAIKKTLIIPNQVPIVIHFQGTRMVVLDNVKHKQSLADKLMKGRVVYISIPSLKSQIQLTPRNKGKSVLFLNRELHYVCYPNPIGLAESSISDNINKEQFRII